MMKIACDFSASSDNLGNYLEDTEYFVLWSADDGVIH